MRKSSILHQSANKKFNSPFLKPLSTASPMIEKVQPDLHIAATGSDNGVRKRSISDIMNLVNQPPPPQDAAKKVRVEHSASATQSPSFGSPDAESCHKSPSTPPALANSTGTQLPLSEGSGATNNARYYSVVWCKKSMKKHKKWEGDAVLIIKGRSATLRSLEGKDRRSKLACAANVIFFRGTVKHMKNGAEKKNAEKEDRTRERKKGVIGSMGPPDLNARLASAFGYKVKEVDAIEEGSIFGIGGKECEIQASISTEEYLSGRCFSDGFVPAATQEDSNLSNSASRLSKNELC